MIVMLLALVACQGWYDPNDCRIRGNQFDDCQPFLPRGQACGLVHGSAAGGGSLGGGRDPAAVLPAGTPAREICPVGFMRSGIADVSTLVASPLGQGFTENDRMSCSAAGNLNDSSGALAEVVNNSACGLSSTGKGYTDNDCLEVDPLAEGCPEGFKRRFALDRAATDGGGHLVVWCELEVGCEADDCEGLAQDPGVLCGLQGGVVPDDPDEFLAQLEVSAIDSDLLQWVSDEVEAGIAPPTCWGGSPADSTCPSGFVTACIGDRYGAGGVNVQQGALCWCAPESARPVSE